MKGIMDMWHLLVVEDEPDIARVLEKGLVYKGFGVTVARSGEAALSKIREGRPDLILLDVMLPDIDGFELCRRIRAMGHTSLPILMLTARDAQADKIAGLDCGADDYITKPFDFEELLARIRAALRRVGEQSSSPSKLEVADVLIDPATRQVWRGGDPLELTVREYELLELLVRNAGQVLTKGQIFEHVWGDDNDVGWEVVKVYINLLRAKLNAGGKADLIHTVRGIGYMFMS
jgi:two-component system, OmpR family, response regulator MprA